MTGMTDDVAKHGGTKHDQRSHAGGRAKASMPPPPRAEDRIPGQDKPKSRIRRLIDRVRNRGEGDVQKTADLAAGTGPLAAAARKALAAGVTDVRLAMRRSADGQFELRLLKAADEGVFIGAFLDPAAADLLALPGGLPADELHITLAYLPAATPELVAKAVAAAAEVADRTRRLTGEVTGQGRFEKSHTGGPVSWAAVDVPGLAEVRAALVDALADYGVDVAGAEAHGWTPHITRKFLAAGDVDPMAPGPVPLLLDAVTVAVGGERVVIPFGAGAEFAKAADDLLSEELVKAHSDGHMADDDEDEDDDDDLMGGGDYLADGLVKAARPETDNVFKNATKRYTLAPWYIPDRLDAHNEWTTADELQKALWGYVRKGQRDIMLQHTPGFVAGELVEAMQWPFPVKVPMQKSDGTVVEREYPAGTVFAGVVWSDWAFDMVKEGKITGLSVGGRAIRVPGAPDAAVKHLAGKHDQSSHGRGGGRGAAAISQHNGGAKGGMSISGPGDNARKEWAEDDPRVLAAADASVASAMQMEPGATALMQDVAAANGGHLIGAEHRLKGRGSTARKIAEDATNDNVSPEEAGHAMSDSVRYTVAFPHDQYGVKAQSAIEQMDAAGYSPRVKNMWKRGDPYNGINVKIRDPGTGREIEVQFHTDKSFEVKEIAHGHYTEYRKRETTLERKQELWRTMRDISDGQEFPKGFDLIQPLMAQPGNPFPKGSPDNP